MSGGGLFLDSPSNVLKPKSNIQTVNEHTSPNLTSGLLVIFWLIFQATCTCVPKSLGHFTVMDGSEAQGDLVLIQTFLLYQFILMLTSIFKSNFHNKAKKVCIKTRSPSPSLPSRTVKWPIKDTFPLTFTNTIKTKEVEFTWKLLLWQTFLFLGPYNSFSLSTALLCVI